MALKQFTIDFQEFTTHQYLRFDEKFWFTTKNLVVYDYVLLKDIFYLINGNSYTEYYSEEKTDIPYIRIGDLSFKYEIDDKNLIYLDDSCEISEDKKLRKDDIILATIGATIGKINLAREFENGTFSNNTILLRLKDKENHNPYFYEKLFQDTLLQKYIWGVVSQKAQPNLQTYDLQNIKIPLIPKPKQDQIVAQIEPIEKKIKGLKSQITPAQEIINKVFAREFEFDLEKFEELRKIRNYYLDLSNFANNKDIRQSVRFHKESATFVMQELKKVTNSKLKKFLAEPIILGASISPSDFDENGEYYYVSMATVKNYKLEIDESQLVSTEYARANMNKSINKNDIIMTRSGVAIGKFALIENDVNGIFADFTMRIRLKNYNHYFAYYYFRSDYFQHLIHTHKKGLQNQNIFPGQIQEFPLVDIPPKDQQKIVYEIKTELDKQEEIKQKIEAERNKIDEIIEGAINGGKEKA
jgi:type I restriction enzyme, S subunit